MAPCYERTNDHRITEIASPRKRRMALRGLVGGVALALTVLVAGGTTSVGAEGADPQQVVANAPGHAQMSDQGGPANADGLCTAYYAIQGERYPPR